MNANVMLLNSVAYTSWNVNRAILKYQTIQAPGLRHGTKADLSKKEWRASKGLLKDRVMTQPVGIVMVIPTLVLTDTIMVPPLYERSDFPYIRKVIKLIFISKNKIQESNRKRFTWIGSMAAGGG